MFRGEDAQGGTHRVPVGLAGEVAAQAFYFVGDLDGNGAVDVADLILLIAAWGGRKSRSTARVFSLNSAILRPELNSASVAMIPSGNASSNGQFDVGGYSPQIVFVPVYDGVIDWDEWLAGASPVGRAARLLPINNVRRDREHGLRRVRTAIGWLLAKLVHESLNQPAGDLVDDVLGRVRLPGRGSVAGATSRRRRRRARQSCAAHLPTVAPCRTWR